MSSRRIEGCRWCWRDHKWLTSWTVCHHRCSPSDLTRQTTPDDVTTSNMMHANTVQVTCQEAHLCCCHSQEPVAYLERAKWGSGDVSSPVPVWSRGKATVEGLGDKVPYKLKLFELFAEWGTCKAPQMSLGLTALKDSYSYSTIRIFTDYQTLIITLSRGPARQPDSVCTSIWSHLSSINKTSSIHIQWIPAHIGIPGNTLADLGPHFRNFLGKS